MNRDQTLNNLFRAVLTNAFPIVIIFLLSIVGWFYTYTSTPKTYEAKTTLIFSTEDVSDFSGFTPYQRVDLNEKVLILKSRSNIFEVVNSLNLSYKINDLYQVGARQATYFDEIKIELDPSTKDQFVEISLSLNNKGFNIINQDNDLAIDSEYLEYGVLHKIGNFSIILERDNNKQYLNEEIIVEYIKEENLIKKFQDALKVEQSVQSGISVNPLIPVTTLDIKYSNTDRYFALIFLESIIEAYKRDIVLRKSSQANNSLNFLNTSINQVENLLIESQKKLESFQEENQFLDNNLGSNSLASRLASLEEKINEAELNRIDLESRYSSESSNITSLNSKIKLLNDEKNTLIKEISILPINEQAYINLVRDITVNQNLLESLLNMRLEFSLAKASTISDLSIGEEPFITSNVNPKPITLLVYFFILGSFLSIIVILWRSFLFKKLEYPVEVEEIIEPYGTKLIGVIPNLKDTKFEDLDSKDIDIMSSISTNLSLDPPKRLVITGPTKGVGKTLSSYLIANMIARTGKKVILLDFDLRQGDLGRLFDSKRTSLENFFNIKSDIENYKSRNENLYVFPGIRSLADYSSTFFVSEKVEKVIESLYEDFDMVIIDTAPLLSISETLLVMQKADLVLCICRQDKTYKKDLEELLQISSTANSKGLNIVFNGMERRMNLYSYGNYDYYYKRYYEKNYEYKSNS